MQGYQLFELIIKLINLFLSSCYIDQHIKESVSLHFLVILACNFCFFSKSISSWYSLPLSVRVLHLFFVPFYTSPCWYTSLLSATTDVWMSSLLIALSWLQSHPSWPAFPKPLVDVLFTKLIKLSSFIYSLCNCRDQPRNFSYQLILCISNHWLIQYCYKTTVL